MPSQKHRASAAHEVSDTAKDRAPAGRVAYSPAETAELLGASRAWVYLRLDDGTIPSVKIGGKRFIPAHVVDELLAVTVPVGGDAA